MFRAASSRRTALRSLSVADVDDVALVDGARDVRRGLTKTLDRHIEGLQAGMLERIGLRGMHQNVVELMVRADVAAVSERRARGSLLEHLDLHAGDACSLLFALRYPPDASQVVQSSR